MLEVSLIESIRNEVICQMTKVTYIARRFSESGRESRQVLEWRPRQGKRNVGRVGCERYKTGRIGVLMGRLTNMIAQSVCVNIATKKTSHTDERTKNLADLCI